MNEYEENRLCFICRHAELTSIVDSGGDVKYSFHCEKNNEDMKHIEFYNNKFYKVNNSNFEKCENYILNGLNVAEMKIEQINVDYFQIEMYNRKIKICGGDLESLFGALFGVEEIK